MIEEFIVTPDGKKFRLIRKINSERFSSEEELSKFIHNITTARRQDDTYLYIVDELQNAEFTDIPEKDTI